MFFKYKLSCNLWKFVLLMLFLSCSPMLLNAEPLKILPIGNSITQGDKDHFSYRYSLWKKLIDANVSFDFVGSLSTNKDGNPSFPSYKGKTFDTDHEGHYGWTIDELLNGNKTEPNAGKLSQWLQGYTPDIVLLHAGSNDALKGQSLESTVEELKELVRQIRQKNPGVTILMAKLIPADPEKVGPSQAENIQKLNDRIATLAPQLNSNLSNVVLVDQFTGFNPKPDEDTYDGLHPNTRGEEKMATKWFEALSPLFKPLAIGEELENKHNFLLYPTLVSNQQLQVKAEKLQPLTPVEINIYTVDGKLAIHLKTKADSRGNLAAEIEVLNNLRAGLYITSIATPDVSFTRKFIISR